MVGKGNKRFITIVSFMLLFVIASLQSNVFSQEEKKVEAPVLGSNVNLQAAGLDLAKMTLVEHTFNCLTDCHSVVEFTPLKDFTYDFDTISGYYVNGTESNGVKDLEFTFYKQVERVQEIDDFSTNCTIVNHENGSSSDLCTTNKVGYHNYTYTEYEEIPFNGLKSFKFGETYRINIDIHREPKLGPNYVDWRLNFNGFEVPWAWAVSEMPYRKAIQINNSANEILRKYHTLEVSGLDTTDITRWNLTNPNSFAVTCNDVELDKVIGNRTDLTSAGQTKYYPESTGWGTTNTTFLFRLNENISASYVNNTLCYIYYGNLTYNSTKTNISNIALFYDDFNRVSVGNRYGTSTSLWSIVNGRAQQGGGFPNFETIYVNLDIGDCENCEKYEIWGGVTDNGATANWGVTARFDWYYNSYTSTYAYQNIHSNSTGNLFMKINQESNPDLIEVNDGANLATIKSISTIINATKLYSLRYIALDDINRGDIIGYVDGEYMNFNVTNLTSPKSNGGAKRGLFIGGSGYNRQVDYIMVKRWMETQPTITLGPEESNNSAPLNASPNYNVSIAYNFTNLNCSSRIYDYDGDNMTVFFNLTVDGIQKAEQILTNQLNGSQPSWEIAAANYSKGQTVKCNITLYDGHLYSASNSTSIVISNSVPVVENYNTSSLNRTLVNTTQNVTFQENETVRFSVNISDNDTSDSHWYSWFVDDTPDNSSTSSWFDRAWNFFSGGLHTVRVVVNDSSNANVSHTWNVNVVNVINKYWTLSFVSPTPDNNSNLTSTSVNISVQVNPSILAESQPIYFVDDEAAEFNLGTYTNATYNSSLSAIVINKTLIANLGIFSDGFESGLGNWGISGSGNVWTIADNGSSYQGGYHTLAQQTTGSTNITANVSTLGYNQINVSYFRRLSFGSNDFFSVEWFDGTNWNMLESIIGTTNDASYVGKSYLLSSTAENNSNFKLRFTCKADAAPDLCRVDFVNVNGTKPVYTTDGIFVSRIYDANESITWSAINWTESLASGTDLRFQLRSCNNSDCSDGIFSGPDQTSATYYTVSGESISAAQRRYSQYKAYLTTTNFSLTPSFYNITIKALTDAVYSTANTSSVWLDMNGQNVTMSGSNNLYSYVNNSLTIGDYVYRVYSNDSYGNVNFTETRRFRLQNYNITFNVTSGEDGSGLNNTAITCNYSGFSQGSDTSNAYGPYVFPVGDWECTFVASLQYDKTTTFTVDDSKTIQITLEKKNQLTIQEHDWLKAIYDCLHTGGCDVYNLVNGTNQTVSKIWQQYLPTDRSVLQREDFLSNTSSPSQNISINYTINIPFKDGFNDKELLPLRIFYWFTDTNGKCYNQDKETNMNRAETPFCIPLMAEYLGPNNGSVSFRVDLHPNLPTGTYQVVRSIDIDPPMNGEPIWINYGREQIGRINVINDLLASSAIDSTEDTSVQANAPKLSGLSGITGSVIDGVKNLGGGLNLNLIIIFAMLCLTVITLGRYKYKK